MPATFITTYEPPVATLTIVGELDVASRGSLARRLVDLGALRCSTVRLDVGQVTYVDACSMRLIDRAREQLEASGATMELTAASLCFGLISTAGGFTALAAASVPGTSGARSC
jgi:anti-anti-sigma factor